MNDTIMMLLAHIETRAIQSAVLRSRLDIAQKQIEEAAEVGIETVIEFDRDSFEEGVEAAEDYEPDVEAIVEGGELNVVPPEEEEEVTFEPCGAGFGCEGPTGFVALPAEIRASLRGFDTYTLDTPESREWAVDTLRERILRRPNNED